VILDYCRLSCNRNSTVELLVFYGLVAHRPILGRSDVHYEDLAFHQTLKGHSHAILILFKNQKYVLTSMNAHK